jgi:hypothetical protein
MRWALAAMAVLVSGCMAEVGPLDEEESTRISASNISVGATVKVCNATSLNNRSGPGTSYAILRALPPGTEATVVATSGVWYELDIQGARGWSHGSYLCLVSSSAPPVSTGKTGSPRHTVLYYLNETAINESDVTPLVAYIDPSGQPKDWMFDGMMIFNVKLENGLSPSPQTVLDYERALFDDGQLAELASIVATLRVKLNAPTYRLKVYLAAPYEPKGGVAGVKTALGKLISRFKALGRDEIQLVGFYWGYEEGFKDWNAPTRMSAVASYLHGAGYELTWIPYFTALSDALLCKWKSYGFDHVNLQPNYFNTKTATKARFADVDRKRRLCGLHGVEREFSWQVTNQSVPGGSDMEKQTESGRDYLEASDTYGWVNDPWNVYYVGQAIATYGRSGYSSWRTVLYDGIYKQIAAHR